MTITWRGITRFLCRQRATGGKPDSPGTAYNSISVAASDVGATSSVGPTTDGRSKPDITAPAGATSFSTPQVSGAAAILYQAGQRGDGGSGTAAMAIDDRTIKALLLNGATKPAGWSHTATTPLDPTSGSGVLNVYRSYQNLRAGRQTPTVATSTTLGGTHTLSPAATGSVATLSGWDFQTITTSSTTDAVNHYLFTLSSGGGSAYNLVGTLTWERQLGQTNINNLDLYLYNLTTGALVDESISGLDNVEQLDTNGLAPGRYDLQVLKHGGVASVDDVSDAETYALAYSFAAVPEPGMMVGIVGLWALLIRRRGRAGR